MREILDFNWYHWNLNLSLYTNSLTAARAQQHNEYIRNRPRGIKAASTKLVDELWLRTRGSKRANWRLTWPNTDPYRLYSHSSTYRKYRGSIATELVVRILTVILVTLSHRPNVRKQNGKVKITLSLWWCSYDHAGDRVDGLLAVERQHIWRWRLPWQVAWPRIVYGDTVELVNIWIHDTIHGNF